MASTRLITAIVAGTMGLSGFLLFQVQPVMAKYILPWFGGSATTWIVCMLFFQIALLVGYAYAYAVTRPLPLKLQAGLQILILLAAIALLPITPADSWKPLDAGDPTGRIIALLALSVGIPYAVLATTSPLLQRWLTRIEGGIDVSRLFAVSNLGSFLGLLSYPFVFERLISSPAQTRWWSVGFVVYAALFAICAALVLRFGRNDVADRTAAVGRLSKLPQFATGLWIGLSALGSIMLLGTTNQITQWSAVVPFLWVAPLSLYLLTFVIAFGNPRFYDRAVYSIVFLSLSGLALVLARPESSADLLLQIGLQCAAMFAGCMICHAEMVRLKPDDRRLPMFYLATAIGGALGGIIVALVAPLVFSDYWEYPLAIIAVAVISLLLAQRRPSWDWRRAGVSVAFGAFLLGFGTSLYAGLAGERDVVERLRNFYGVVKVLRTDMDDPEMASLTMLQAGVEQGSQFLAPSKRRLPACSFDADSGIGRALAGHAKRRINPDAPLRIGIIGLGAGMIASHGKQGDVLRYYELNPAVADLANRHFTFTKDTPAKVEVALGDGRILLDREPGQKFDVLVIDAFRGASPPMHLMTKEAFEIYTRHIEPDGIISVNFELDTFEMAPLHRGLAAAFGLTVGWFETKVTDDCEDGVSWALYTRDQSFWTQPRVKEALSPWRDDGNSQLLWTDQSSNLMSILNWGR